MKHSGKDIRIAYLPLHVKVYGITAEADDCFIVGINEAAAGITKRHAIGHELAHIFLNHFGSNKPLRELEREANREAWNYYRAYRDNRL